MLLASQPITKVSQEEHNHMQHPKTTLAGYIGIAGTLAALLGTIGSACGAGQVCGWFSLGALVVSQLSNAFGNIVSSDGGH